RPAADRFAQRCSPNGCLPFPKYVGTCSSSSMGRSPCFRTFARRESGRADEPMARVLVIETGDVRRMSALLSEQGFTVVTAEEAGEAIDVLSTFRPEVIALEVRSPDARALQACTLIRAATTTPLIVLSYPCAERAAIDAFTAGADSVV